MPEYTGIRSNSMFDLLGMAKSQPKKADPSRTLQLINGFDLGDAIKKEQAI